MEAINVAADVARIVVALLGFAALWSLWIARDKRRNNWTRKMRKIWLCHFLLVAATTSGNIELLYRHVYPTAALFVVGATYILTISGTFDGENYTKQ